MSRLVEILKELEEAPVKPAHESAEEKVAREFRGLAEEDKWARAYEMKLQGFAPSAIAKVFDVDQSTIYRWMRKHHERYRRALEQEPAANLLAEHLQFLDHIEEVCLHEATMLKSDEAVIDPDTGTVTRGKNVNVGGLKTKWIQTALKARQMKIETMTSSGILPKEAEGIYKKMEDEKRVDKVEESSAPTRSKEEIAENIARLLERGRRL